MAKQHILVTKASGLLDQFSEEKLRKSLAKSGANADIIDNIILEIQPKLYDGISTKKIYQLAFSLLKKSSRSSAGRYNLKRAIMALGPSGFPFEQYIAAIFEWQGYKVQTQLFMEGACVTHEIDVLAEKEDHYYLIECKYHNGLGVVSDVKVPLYIHSRYRDVLNEWNKHPQVKPLKGCVVTNTKFSSDAIKYGVCSGLYMLGWDYPAHKSLSNMVDESRLYPITCLTTLTISEKEKILGEGIVLCSSLLQQESVLKQSGIATTRIFNIIAEIKSLCK
jgi:Restriction endonuclease